MTFASPLIVTLVVLIFWYLFAYNFIEVKCHETEEDFSHKVEQIYAPIGRMFSGFLDRTSSDSDPDVDDPYYDDWHDFEDLTGVVYPDYLESDAWQERRQIMLERSGNECERCGSERRLEIHHLTYKRLGSEWMSDLSVLCRNCHASEHGLTASPSVRQSQTRAGDSTSSGELGSRKDDEVCELRWMDI
jgi:hypothetical protein